MGKYLITGRQGSGKTTVIRALSDLGYTSYNTDDLPEVTKLQDKGSGEIIDWPKGVVDWNRYSWNWQRPGIDALLRSDETVFLGAVVSNQADFYTMFDRVFVITVTADTLRTRLQIHEHTSHHLPGVIDRILHEHEKRQNLFISEGAEPISGERPTLQTVNEILQIVGSM